MPIPREEFYKKGQPLDERILDVLKQDSEKAYTPFELWTFMKYDHFPEAFSEKERNNLKMTWFFLVPDEKKELHAVLDKLDKEKKIEWRKINGDIFVCIKKL